MPKKPMNRTFTEPTSQQEKEKVPKHNHSSMSLNRQLSVMEGGSCPSSPQVKKACRLVVLGSTQTGKTSVLNRFLNDTFDDCYLPTIENFHRKLYRIHGEFYQLDILDTSGNDPFPAARRLSLLTGDLFLLVFSVDKPGSYEEIFRLRDQILEAKDTSDSSCSPLLNGRSSKSGGGMLPSLGGGASTSSASSSSAADRSTVRVPMAVAANKLDLPAAKHAVNVDEVRAKIMGLNSCAFVECSAKTGQNINELFARLFAMAKLPKQMSPGQHRHVGLEKSVDSALPQSSPRDTGEFAGCHHHSNNASSSAAANRKSKTSIIRLRSKHSEPAVAFDAEARRPSLRTDLMLLRAKQSTNVNVFASTNLTASTNTVNGIYNNNSNMKARKCVIQ